MHIKPAPPSSISTPATTKASPSATSPPSKRSSPASSPSELATSNAAQVTKIKGILESLDFEIATSDEAREMLHLKGADKVNF